MKYLKDIYMGNARTYGFFAIVFVIGLFLIDRHTEKQCYLIPLIFSATALANLYQSKKCDKDS